MSQKKHVRIFYLLIIFIHLSFIYFFNINFAMLWRNDALGEVIGGLKVTVTNQVVGVTIIAQGGSKVGLWIFSLLESMHF